MKNYLIGWQRYETTFDGEPVSMELLPLRRGEFLRLLPILDKYYRLSQKTQEAGADITEHAEEIGQLIEVIESVVVGHVREIRGFQVNGIEPPQVEDVVSAAIFMPLVADIVFRLVEISKVGKADGKNSEGQSTNRQ